MSRAGVPILPTNQVFVPRALRMAWMMEAVVPLPLVPVTPIIGAGQCSKKYLVILDNGRVSGYAA